MSVEVVVLDPADLRAAHTLFAETIHRGPATDERWPRIAPTYSPGRTLGIRDGSELLATATSFPTRTTVPGGARLPTAAVTRVGVRADHTRRGLLTALMATQLATAGEVLATLRASEARIYRRFGYGVATRFRDLRVRRVGGAGWHPAAPRGGRVRLLARDAVLPALTELYTTLPLQRPGAMTRPGWWWDADLRRRLDDDGSLLVAVHRGAGGDDGFAVAAPGGGGADGSPTLRVSDLHAADPIATAGLWRFLLGVDLTTAVTAAQRPLDEPLELLLADPRDCATTEQEDETWLRLLDVPAALVARSWGVGEPVLLGVHDALLPANAGLYRLADGTVERVPVGTPDLECDVADLAMAYLGDRAPSALVAAGRWAAPRPAAVARADALFAVSGSPWCGTYF